MGFRNFLMQIGVPLDCNKGTVIGAIGLWIGFVLV